MDENTPMTAETSLQCTIRFQDRGLDKITRVKKKNNRYYLYIDTKHGEKEIGILNMNDHTLQFSGDSRVHPFTKLDLSKNGAQKLRRDLRNEFDIKTP